MSTVNNAIPAYFELSWAILSTIGLLNILIGFMVLGITSFSPIWLVPVVTSGAGAIANGLCYYAFYADYPVVNTATASAFADLAWLVSERRISSVPCLEYTIANTVPQIQEAGLSFYSYVILSRVLSNRARTIFLAIFWTLIIDITAIRAVILITRVHFILDTNPGSGGATQTSATDLALQALIDNLHVGYFSSIALVECSSAWFLLREFRAARKLSARAALKQGLFSYLMRSTEIRLALLAVVGVTRAVTYSFQNTAQSATGTAGQLDRFAYTLECVFPIVMYIDMIASRLVFASNSNSGGLSVEPGAGYGIGSGGRQRGYASGVAAQGIAGTLRSHQHRRNLSDGGLDLDVYPYPARGGNRTMSPDGKLQSGGETVTRVSSDVSSSQEYIIEGARGVSSARRLSSSFDGDGDIGVAMTVAESGEGGGARKSHGSQHHHGNRDGAGQPAAFDTFHGLTSPV